MRGRRSLRAAGTLALAATLLALQAPAVRGQALDRADSLASAGRAEEAREALMGWWSDDAPRAPRGDLQRALWLRALLTVDPAQAALDYQRLVVEYPGGRWTDGALLRLAQAERAAGRPRRALGYLQALARDYPSSPHRLRARSLLDEVQAEADREPGTPAPAMPARRDTAATPVPATRMPPAPVPATPGPATPATPEARGPYTVQLGAFSTRARAEALVQRVRAAGFEPRLVRVQGSTLVRVRSDRFLTRDGAERRRGEIAARGFDALVVADADREEAVP